jgi:putative ABC transport system ATP-binding protein
MILIKDLCKKFPESSKPLFENYNIRIKDGEFVIFSGKSGCGKTTLLNMIGAIEPFTSGSIIVDDIDISKRKNKLTYLREKVAFVFQNFALIEGLTVKENLNIIKKKSRTNVEIPDALKKVGLSEKIDTKVYKLSGGEQQRIALARIMLKKCDLILADEPTGSLDKENAKIVIDSLKEFNKSGKTIILVTHDERLFDVANVIFPIE